MSNLVITQPDDDGKLATLHSKFAAVTSATGCNNLPKLSVQDMLRTLQVDFADVDYGRTVPTDDGEVDEEEDEEED